MSRKRILVADDDHAVRASLTLLLKQQSYEVLEAADTASTLARFKSEKPDLVLLDMNFSAHTSGEEGLFLLRQMKRLDPDCPVLLITAWGSIELAVQGIRSGANDFITKPWHNSHLVKAVETALHLAEGALAGTEISPGREQLDRQYSFDNLIGEEPSFLHVLHMVGRVARTDATVLIIGESGTGKELVAEAIHANSPRASRPFVRVNLGGVHQALFESEMFGHKKGSFTDAHHDRIGRFELAEMGSIFLDEIGELDLSSQVKMLHVLQNRSFERLGESKSINVDVRVICATNRDLTEMVSRHTFREDLYYRINLITIHLPPLRERRNDIALLAQNFLSTFAERYDRPSLAIRPRALEWLKELPWPGNIRELKNLVERTILVSGKEKLDIDDFFAQLQTTPRHKGTGNLPAVGSMTLDDMEKAMILKAVEFHDGNLTRVARSLGISRGALYRRMEKYGMEP